MPTQAVTKTNKEEKSGSNKTKLKPPPSIAIKCFTNYLKVKLVSVPSEKKLQEPGKGFTKTQRAGSSTENWLLQDLKLRPIAIME